MRKRPFDRRALAALILGLLLAPGAVARAEPGPASQVQTTLDPAGLLLFSITLDDLTLSDGIGAYGEPTDPLIPLGEMAALLEADIDVFPAERRVTGRLGAARRTVAVDLASGQARAGGEAFAVSPNDWAVSQTDIYLRASLISRLLGVRLVVADDELVLRMTTTEPFPVQARLGRAASRRGLGGLAGIDEPVLAVDDPYTAFSPPGVDIILDAGTQRGAAGRTFRYDIRLAGDLLWSNLQAYMNSDEEGRANNARMMLQRRSLEGALLGPLKAREVTLGDTYAPALSMGPRSIAGRGFTVSTAPLEQTSVFNQIDLRGELPPGFEVELFINDVLRGSTNRAINGRFEFLDIPLSPGLNVLRVITYGPRGERTEEVQVVNVGAALLRRGESQLTMGVVEQNTPLFRLRGDQVIGDPTIFANGGVRATANLNYGLTDLLTVSAGLARVPQVRGGGLTYVSAGARTTLFGIATQVDIGRDGRGGEGASAALAGRVGEASYVLRHAEYRDRFVDENNLGFNPLFALRRRSELTVDSSVNLRGRIIPVSMRTLRNEYAGHRYDLLSGVRASSSVGRVLMSAGLEYQRQAYRPARPVETLKGYIAASSFDIAGLQLRATFDYELLPEVKARFLAVSVDRRLSDDWSLRLGLGQPLDDLDGWNLALSAVWATRQGDWAFTGQYDNAQDDWRLAAQWTFGLGFDPERRRYDLMRSGPGASGSVLFSAFMDENGDGLRQDSEVAAADVGVDGGATRGAVTNGDGRLLLTGLGAGPRARLDVGLDQLDGEVSAPPTRVEVKPRPGRTIRVDYPLRPTGGVVVKVELQRDDGRVVGLASVRVLLTGPAANTPLETTTEFDGTAVFDGVPLGAWRIMIDPRQAERLRMQAVDAPEVVIRAGGDHPPDVRLRVRFEPATVAVVAAIGGAQR